MMCGRDQNAISVEGLRDVLGSKKQVVKIKWWSQPGPGTRVELQLGWAHLELIIRANIWTSFHSLGKA